MAIELTTDQEKKVSARRKSARPSVYSPTGGGATTISKDFEAWLILTPKSIKAKAINWVKELQKVEADREYEDLLKECLDVEATSLEVQDMDLSSATQAFTDWRSNPSISGYETVTEISWLFQELQQGMSPHQELDEVTHHVRLRQAVADRYPISKKSTADRKTRLNTWVSVLNSY